MSSIQQNQTVHLINMENSNTSTHGPIQPSQHKSPFFNILGYDIRSLIYEKMMLPPFSDQYLGFVLSCRQAKDETDSAVFRMHSALQYLETVKKRLDAKVSVKKTRDLTQTEVSIKIRKERERDLTINTMRTTVKALLPLLRLSSFARVTIIFGLEESNYCKEMPSSFNYAILGLVHELRADFREGPDADLVGSTHGPKWVTRIGFAIEYMSGHKTLHKIHGSQYTCGEDMSLFWEKKRPDYSIKDEQLEAMPFLYFMRSDDWQKIELGMFSPTPWTVLGARAVHLPFLYEAKMVKGHLMTKDCSSSGIGQGIVDTSDAVKLSGGMSFVTAPWRILSRVHANFRRLGLI